MAARMPVVGPADTTVSFKTGKVTGGTGAFKGATGTIKATANSYVKEAFTITYRT